MTIKVAIIITITNNNHNNNNLNNDREIFRGCHKELIEASRLQGLSGSLLEHSCFSV